MERKLLKDIKYFVLDMDGTFYLGDKILDGSLKLIDKIKSTSNMDFLFFTNNSSKNKQVYIEKLYNMGCLIEKNQIVTSGDVTINYIKSKWKNPKIYLVGTPMLKHEFIENDILITDNNPDAVVIGFDTTLTYEKISKACAFIRNKIPFIATHTDYNCPTEYGPIPDCGSICALITASTGIKPKYLGKPNVETLTYILEHLHCNKDELAFVGDRLYTDIAIGSKHDVKSILVLTGESNKMDIAVSEHKPDIVVQGLRELLSLL